MLKQPLIIFLRRPKSFIRRVETIDGSANEGEDYVAVNEILTFEPYETEKEVGDISTFSFFPFLLRGKNLYLQIGVTIVDDNQWEPDEEFFLKLTMLQVWASLELICHHFVTIVNFCLLRLFWSTWSMMLQGHGNGEVKLGRTSIMEITILNDDGLFKSLRV